MATQRTFPSVLLALLPIGCGLILVLGVILALAAFVWPGFLKSPAVPPINDPMTLVPGDSNWVLGADLDAARMQGVLEPVLSFVTNPPPVVPGEPLPQAL